MSHDPTRDPSDARGAEPVVPGPDDTPPPVPPDLPELEDGEPDWPDLDGDAGIDEAMSVTMDGDDSGGRTPVDPDA